MVHIPEVVHGMMNRARELMVEVEHIEHVMQAQRRTQSGSLCLFCLHILVLSCFVASLCFERFEKKQQGVEIAAWIGFAGLGIALAAVVHGSAPQTLVAKGIGFLSLFLASTGVFTAVKQAANAEGASNVCQ